MLLFIPIIYCFKPVAMTPAITKTLQRIKTKFHNFAELLEAFTQQQRLLSMEDTAPIETPEHNPVAKPNPF